MAARRLTEDQKRIVETLDKPLFVAAGAGSGKSSTLAERVAWALDPASGPDGTPFITSLDQVLVITFTHLAADEIKEKIRERLREGGMDHHALAVDSAWISTIHGMCSRILKRHAFDLGIDPSFTVLETHDAYQLVEKAIDETLREVREKGLFRELFDMYQARSQRGGDAKGTVFGMVYDLRNAAGSALEGFDSLRFPGVTPDVDAALRTLRDNSERALVFGRSEKAFGSKTGVEEEARLERDLGVIENYLQLPPGQRGEALSETMSSLTKPNGRAYGKKTMKEIGGDLRRSYSDAVLAAAFQPMGALSKDLVQLAKMVDDRYRLFKEERGVLDNDDLLSRTFDAFRTHPEIAGLYGSKFHLVMVDEFQDTNAQQVQMIEMLSGTNACHLTTVGDAQQSIYRFRAADVQVFRDREATSDPSSRVRLAMNFRSHADILSFVERCLAGGVLPDFMRLDPCPTRTDGLRARDLPRIDIEMVSTTTKDTAPSATCSQALAALIADRINERIDHGERPEDVALLLGRMTNLDKYLDALRKRGIDCVVSGGSTFTRAVEVRLILSLLRMLANPKDTQSGLFPVLVSDLFSLEADDLCLLATKVQEKNGAFARRGIDLGLLGLELPGDVHASPRLRQAHEVLVRALERSRSWKTVDVLRAVLDESGWLARNTQEGAAGLARVANALAAIRHVGELVDKAGLGLSRAAFEFAQWLDLTKAGPATLTGGEGGAVRIMTVHASKGLEFPVVAIADCWGSQNRLTISGVTCENRQGVVDAALVPQGIGADDLGPEPEDVSESSSLIDWARNLTYTAQEGDQQERARLLYVAITRARETAILGMNVKTKVSQEVSPELAADVVGTLFGGQLPPTGETSLNYGGSAPARVRHIALSADKAEGSVIVEPETLAPIVIAEEEAEEERFLELYDTKPDDSPSLLGSAQYTSLRDKVFSYSSAHALIAEAFLSQAGDAEEDASAVEVAPVMQLTDEEDLDEPVGFEDSDKATDLGSAFHELAQTMVETRSDHDPARLDALSAYWHLSEKAKARLRAAIALWERSEIRSEALSHGVLRPEAPFFIKVDSAYGEYVEGAIDLLCTDPGSDHALVIDYKTGDAGLSMDEVYARHEMQANFYAYVMRSQGCRSVECAFVCVERDRGDGQPVVVRYTFDDEHPPRI